MAATGTLAQSLKRLLPKKAELPPILQPRTGNLYEVLSRTPSGGIGCEVHQTRWTQKQIPGCYWVVTRSQFKLEGKHGKAWGHLHWKGVPVSAKEERIPGALKYAWKQGRSRAPPPPKDSEPSTS